MEFTPSIFLYLVNLLILLTLPLHTYQEIQAKNNHV